MRNPYDILGVPQNADREQINAAYRRLAAQYTDKNQTAKLDELNEAYDQAILGAASGSSYSSYAGDGYVSDYSDIRSKIDAHRLEDAQVLLDGIPDGARDAQWYYLKGVVYHKKGWLDEAAKNFSTAVNMEPNNGTYKSAYNTVMNQQNGGYKENRKKSGDDSSGCCSACLGALCLDSCCECCGGDLIPGC